MTLLNEAVSRAAVWLGLEPAVPQVRTGRNRIVGAGVQRVDAGLFGVVTGQDDDSQVRFRPDRAAQLVRLDSFHLRVHNQYVIQSGTCSFDRLIRCLGFHHLMAFELQRVSQFLALLRTALATMIRPAFIEQPQSIGAAPKRCPAIDRQVSTRTSPSRPR